MNKNANVLTGGWLKGKKTYLTAALGILTALSAYAVGEMALPELIQTVFTLGSVMFVRKGISDK